jgi:hypothetical protein
VKLLGEVSEKHRCGGSYDDVVHVEENVGDLCVTLVDEKRDIGLRSNEAQPVCKESEPLVPGAGSLLKTIE